MDAIDQQFEAIVQRSLSIKLKQQHAAASQSTKLQAATLVSNQSGKTSEPQEASKDSNQDGNRNQYLVGSFEIWVHGLATVIGGVYYGWNSSLTVGFGSYFLGQVIMGLAYCVLVCGLCEIVSSTAFSGGSYGMARVVLGFYPGFMMAMAEVFEYCVYTSLSAVFVADFFVAKLHLHEEITPLIWLAFYASGVLIVLAGGKVYWRVIIALGIFSLVIVCLYFFAALPITDLPRYASLHRNTANPGDMSNWFAGGLAGFLEILPATTSAFGGIESIVLITDRCKSPKVDLPRGLVASVFTLFGVIVAMVLVACACPPGLNDGAFAQMPYFMNAGFALGGLGFSGNVSEWLLLPSQYAMAFGFIWPGSKLLYTISQSNLFPQMSFPTTNKSLLRLQNDEKGAVLTFCLFGYLICLVGWYVPTVNFANIAILLGFITYFSDMMAYYKLQTIFASVQRDYRSPFGIVAAVLACLFFALSIVGLGLQDVISVYFVLGGFVVISVYYFTYATYRQTFSEMEQKSLLVLHVIVFNLRKQERMRKSRAPPTAWGNLMKSMDKGVTLTTRTVSSVLDSVLAQLGGGSAGGSANKHNTVAVEPVRELAIVPAPVSALTASTGYTQSQEMAMSHASSRANLRTNSMHSTAGGEEHRGLLSLSVRSAVVNGRSFAMSTKRPHAPSRRGSIGLELGQIIPNPTQPFLISGKVNLLDYYAQTIIVNNEVDEEEGQPPPQLEQEESNLQMPSSVESRDDDRCPQPIAPSMRLASL